MPKTYTARQGEAWDQIAYTLWGEEKRMHLLLEANPQFRRVVLFSGGEVLAVPDADLSPPAATLPPWKQGDAS